MSRNSILRKGLAALGALGFVALTVSASAIEMRTTSGRKTIVRNATLQSEAESVLAEPVAPEVVMPDPVQEFEAGIDDCADACAPCRMPCPPGRMWTEVEFLLWWSNGRYYPPLATSGNPPVLPTASILFGGERENESPRPGGRLEVGLWLDPWQRLGIGGHLTAVRDALGDFRVTSDEYPFLGRPVQEFSNGTFVENALTVASSTRPSTGWLNIHTNSEVLASDLFVRSLLGRTPRSRVDLLYGYQFSRINEDLAISSFTTAAPYTLSVTDKFATMNEFHGGHFGLLSELRRGPWGLELQTKFGLGNMHQTAVISGEQVATTSGTPDTRSRGLLATTTNSGIHEQDDFCFMQDVGLKLAYRPTERLKLSFGYSMLFWSSVLRPGNVVDTRIDTRLLPPNPGQASPALTGNELYPAFSFNSKAMYLQGLNVGLECQF
jgi:hypothetical protein